MRGCLAAGFLAGTVITTCAAPLGGLWVAAVLAAPTPPTPDELAIVSQSFDVAADTAMVIELRLPSDVAATTFDAGATISITSYPAIVDRQIFLDALSGRLQRSDDTFDIALDPVAADPNVARPSTDAMIVTVPTESTLRTKNALQLAQAGVHPVVVDIRIDGRIVAEVSTFVHRLRLADVATEAMSVALVLGQTSEPVVALDGTVDTSDEALEEYTRLADTLEAIDAAAVAVGLDAAPPRTIGIEPLGLQALATASPSLAARLGQTLTEGTLLSMPRLPLDPSAASAIAQGERYTQFLRQGEDALRAAVPQGRVDRSVYVADAQLTDSGATLRRDLGTRVMVMGFDHFITTEGSTGLLTDASQLLTTVLTDGSSIPTAVIDPYLAERFDGASTDPHRSAIEVVADLLVIAASIEADGLFVGSHGMLLGRSDIGVPDAAFAGQLVELLLTTEGIELIDVNDLVTTVDAWVIDGQPVELTLPETAGTDVTARFELIDDVALRIFAHASMLPENDPEAASWGVVLDALPSTAVSDSRAELMVAQLDEEFAAVRGCVVAPEPFSFTLTGKNNTIQFKLTNLCDKDLRIRVRLNSAKLEFPDGDQAITLIASSDTSVEVRADALSNGKSSVFLRVYPPATDDLQVVPEVPLTARVNSLAGLGQLLTGAGLLLIASWWVHNWRRSRRQSQAAHHLAHHPASVGGAAGTDIDTDTDTDAGSNLPAS